MRKGKPVLKYISAGLLAAVLFALPALGGCRTPKTDDSTTVTENPETALPLPTAGIGGLELPPIPILPDDSLPPGETAAPGGVLQLLPGTETTPAPGSETAATAAPADNTAAPTESPESPGDENETPDYPIP